MRQLVPMFTVPMFAMPMFTMPGALLLAALVAGCGGQPTPPGPTGAPELPHYTTVSQLVAVAADQQAADRSVKLHLTGVTTENPPNSMLGDGELRYDPGGAIAMQVLQSVQPLDSPAGPAFTLLILPNQAYLKPPAGTVSVQPGKIWFQMRSIPTNPTVNRFNQIVQSLRDSANPTRTFAQLGDGASIVESTDDTLDGVPAVRYKITLDLARATQQQDNPAVMKALADLVASGGASDDTTLWLDARNRPLRMVLSKSVTADDGSHTTYVVTVRYRDWGQPVDIPTPTPAQVVGGN
jgi:hypothetical protein